MRSRLSRFLKLFPEFQKSSFHVALDAVWVHQKGFFKIDFPKRPFLSSVIKKPRGQSKKIYESHNTVVQLRKLKNHAWNLKSFWFVVAPKKDYFGRENIFWVYLLWFKFVYVTTYILRLSKKLKSLFLIFLTFRMFSPNV